MIADTEEIAEAYQQDHTAVDRRLAEKDQALIRRDQIILGLLRKGLTREEIEQIASLYGIEASDGDESTLSQVVIAELEKSVRRQQPIEISEQGSAQIIVKQQKIIAEKNQIINQQAHQITELQDYKHQIHTVLTNGGMSHRDRVTWCVAHILYGSEIMAGRPFRADMAKIQKMASVGKNATGELFAAMKEAGGIKHDWDREKYQNEGSNKDNFCSTVVITPLPGNALVNTKDTAVRAQQREASAKSATRRIERLVSVAIEACPHCGCDDPEMAQTLLVPRCKACGKLRNSDHLEQTSALRILEVKEEPVQIELEPSSAQDVEPRAIPIQDTPSANTDASSSKETSETVPEEPDDIKAWYGEATDQARSANTPGPSSAAAPTPALITDEDRETFELIGPVLERRGIHNHDYNSDYSNGQFLESIRQIIASANPTGEQIQWMRDAMTQIIIHTPLSTV